MKNYYDILGVKEDASDDDIKRTFRKLAMQYHPDRNQGDASAEEKFKEINEAYETLSDKNKKANYDDARNGFGFGQGNVNDFFRDIFNSHFNRDFNRQSHDVSGQDVTVSVRCTLHESVTGANKIISLQTSDICKNCNGTGCKKDKQKNSCLKCRGSGKIVVVQKIGPNQTMQTVTICPDCRGVGKYVAPENKCVDCKDGIVYGSMDYTFDIPAKFVFGTTIRLQGKGLLKNASGQKGDCYVQIIPDDHILYKIDQNLNIVLNLFITSTEAITGVKINIPNVENKPLMVDVPAGVPHGYMIGIYDQGVYKKNGKRSDFVVIINIETSKYDKKHEQLIEQLRSLENSKTNPDAFKLREKINSELQKG